MIMLNLLFLIKMNNNMVNLCDFIVLLIYIYLYFLLNNNSCTVVVLCNLLNLDNKAAV